MAFLLRYKGEAVRFGVKWLWSTLKAWSCPGGLGAGFEVGTWPAGSTGIRLWACLTGGPTLISSLKSAEVTDAQRLIAFRWKSHALMISVACRDSLRSPSVSLLKVKVQPWVPCHHLHEARRGCPGNVTLPAC